jgi:hypothetical protein
LNTDRTKPADIFYSRYLQYTFVYLAVLHFDEWEKQGVTKKGRLSWLTNSALVYEPKCGGGGGCGVSGVRPMGTAVHRSPNKLWRSNFIFNLWEKGTDAKAVLIHKR